MPPRIPEPLLSPLRAVKHAVARAYSRSRAVLGFRYGQLIVCGYPRSGTSLLYNMLSATLPGWRFEPFEVPAIHRIHRLGNIASKYPLDVFSLKDIPALNIHNKKVCVVAMVRDPRDLITSRHPLMPHQYFIGYDHSWWPQDSQFAEWKYDAPGVVDIFRELERLRLQSDIPLHILRYEDLISEPATVQCRLANHLELDFSGEFEAFHQRPEKLAYRYDGETAPKDPSLVRENKPIDPSRRGKWRRSRHRQRVMDQFGECPELFEIVRAYGYEQDNSWYRNPETWTDP